MLFWNLIESAKTRAIDIHEVLRVLLFCICCIFLFCDVLLLAIGKFYFSLFMVATTFDIDKVRSFYYFGACG